MKKNKLLKGTIAFCLAAALLAGCASGSGTSKEHEGQSNNPVRITIGMEGGGLPAPEDDFIKQELDKRLNTDIQMTTIQGLNDYLNQMKIRSAAGNLPDLMMVDAVTLNDFAQKGLLLDLTPYLETKLKTSREFIGDSLLKKGIVNGKHYAITRIADVPFSSFWIRQDWLENLGLSFPETLEDLYKVAKAFTEEDPDGNGKKDTYGFTGADFSTFSPIFGAYAMGTPGASMFVAKDNQVVPTLYDEHMPAALEYIQRLVSENLVDPQFMTNKGTMARDLVIQGKAGIIFTGWTDIGKQEFLSQLKTVNENAKLVQMAAPVGPHGQYDSAFDSERPSRLIVIPKAVEKTPDKLDKILELLEYISSKEGNKLVMYGLEGRHYNEQNGQIVLTEEMAKEGNYFHLYQITGRPNEEYLPVKFPEEAEYIAYAISQPRLNSIDSAIMPPDGFNNSDAERYMKEELTKFVYSKRPLAEYSNFLATMESKFNYKLLLDEAQKRAVELGITQ
ncbi:extracellular solute-binding protein [Paenibacillaceae bacterium]|nr:extracellular solute-binding protein [Paenibacillaceae bacterium]